MVYDITHRTTYDYAEPVTISHHAARMKPRNLPHHVPSDFSLVVHPRPTIQKSRVDYFGNGVSFFSIQEIHQRLEVVAHSRVTVRATTPAVLAISPPWEKVRAMFTDPVSPEAIEPYQFAFDSPMIQGSPKLADYARPSFVPNVPLLNAALDLTKRIFKDFKYDPAATTVATPLNEVVEKRSGVCQDFAHLAIACLRSLGLPARYVSGYLRTHAPRDAEKLVGADASHAWFSLYCPSVGWADFDPTNNMMPAQEHITVAYGRDFGDVSPLSGILTGGGRHEVNVAVDVAVAEE